MCLVKAKKEKIPKTYVHVYNISHNLREESVTKIKFSQKTDDAILKRQF